MPWHPWCQARPTGRRPRSPASIAEPRAGILGRMEAPAPEDPRLTRLTEICDGLPETARQTQGRHADFRVRRRLFASFLDDHHGDGIVALQFKLPGGENEMLLAAEPGRFYLPAYMGARGWLALRLDQGAVDWDEVAELATDSYLRAAPEAARGPRRAAAGGRLLTGSGAVGDRVHAQGRRRRPRTVFSSEAGDRRRHTRSAVRRTPGSTRRTEPRLGRGSLFVRAGPLRREAPSGAAREAWRRARRPRATRATAGRGTDPGRWPPGRGVSR